MQNLDNSLAHPIEDFVRVTNHEHHPDVGIVGLISAVRLITDLRDRFADARRNIPRSAGRTLSQILQNSFSVRKRLGSISDLHRP